MFLGKDQLTFGVVPLDDGCHSAQSAKSVMPISIANCREKREELKRIVVTLNKQKDEIKRNGIYVDGKHYRVSFKGNH